MARRSNQLTRKEINPEYPLEGLMLKLQYFGYLMRRADSLEKTLLLGKIEYMESGEQRRMRQLDSIANSISGHEFKQTPGDSEGQVSLVCCSPQGAESALT